MLDYLLRIKQSYSVAFADFVRAQEAVGKKIVKMQTGDPDFATMRWYKFQKIIQKLMLMKLLKTKTSLTHFINILEMI